MSNSLQTTLNLERNIKSHWSINKPITALDTIGFAYCHIAMIKKAHILLATTLN